MPVWPGGGPHKHGADLSLAWCPTLLPLPCPVPLATSPQATTHFESGLGVAVKGTLPPGSVTLLRIGGARLERLWVEEGYVLQEQGNGTEWSPRLCRTQVRLALACGWVSCARPEELWGVRTACAAAAAEKGR